jgi:DNA-binding transcriptional LysR family regulator
LPVPSLLAGYRNEAPNTVFELRGDAADVVVDNLRRGRIDIGFVSPRPTGADLEWTEITTEQLLLMIPVGHPLASRQEVALTAVANDRFIGLTPAYSLRQVTDRLCRAAGFEPNWAITCAEVSTLRALVAQASALESSLQQAIPLTL